MNIKNFVSRTLLAFAFMFGSVGMLPSNARQANAAAEKLMQYAAAGHILGFGVDKVVLAGLDHALTVSFMSGSGSEPVAAESGKGADGGAPSLGKVTYPQVWPGVDVVYSTSEGNITESTYVMAAGADVADVRLKYNVPLKVLSDGSLSFSFENGEMTESAPIAWQEVDGKRVAVDVKFEKLGAHEVGFVLGAHDPAFGVTIDPTYAWHTFYGSNTGSDVAYGIALDINGNVYVTGGSSATWNGPANESPLHSFSVSSGFNVFVLKLNSQGAYVWHTFYGGPMSTEARAIKILGTVMYITGRTLSSWNGANGMGPLHGYTGGADIFVLKLDANGAYQWHTFYGSTDDDLYGSLDVSLDNLFAGVVGVYVTGSSFNWQGDGFTNPLHAHINGINYDAFILKLNSDGVYQWHTFYGAVGFEQGRSIRSYAGDLYVAVESYETWNGDGAAQPLHAFSDSGMPDLTVLKLSTSGAYQWHTFYGSAETDTADIIDADANGIYLAGHSNNPWNGPASQSPITAYHALLDVVVLKLTHDGAYQWHTFLGGSGDDVSQGMDLLSGTINISGYSTASWTGPGGHLPANPYTGAYDITNIRLDTSGNYLWHTFYGGTADDQGHALVVDALGNLFTAGGSDASWNGPGNISPKHAFGNPTDIVVIKTAPTPVFADVPPAYWAVSSIETLYASGITGGCASNPLTYCPTTSVTRAQMAIFLVRAKHGVNFVPPAATGVFSDVPVGSFGASYIEQLAADGITSGCGGGKFCPSAAVTRAQMAVFLVKARHGAAFVPPTATGMFPDVPVGSFGADYIEQLAADGVTSGCGGGNFCPGTVVKRDSMAVFLVKNFTLP